MTRRPAAAAVALVVGLLMTPRPAAAQDAALRACLLLRSPAECGIADGAPFAAPGDAQALRVLRPDPLLWATQRSSAPDAFSPLRLTLGAETTMEAYRQVTSLPIAWSPLRALSVTADVPVVAQALTESTLVSLGDVGTGIVGRGATGPLAYRLLGAAKLPTGDPARGAGSGALDGLAVSEAWLSLPGVAGALSAGYRHNGGRNGDLLQASLAAQTELSVLPLVDLALQGRLFGHHLTGPRSTTSLHLAVGLEPRVVGVAVGFAYALLPVVRGTELDSGVVVAAGVLVPLGEDRVPPTAPPAPADARPPL